MCIIRGGPSRRDNEEPEEEGDVTGHAERERERERERDGGLSVCRVWTQVH